MTSPLALAVFPPKEKFRTFSLKCVTEFMMSSRDCELAAESACSAYNHEAYCESSY